MRSRSIRFVRAASVFLGFLIVSAAAGAQELTVEFTFNRLPRIASNQLAVWVEDSGGHHVKTLFVTDFTARRQGYRRRVAALPEWVRAFSPATRSAAQVDAVSRATPASGRVTIGWDCTDEEGRPAAAGSYRLRVEGNLFWESLVSYDLPIEIGVRAFSVEPLPYYSSPEGGSDSRMISDVRVSYLP